MIRIGNRNREGIIKDSLRFFKTDLMFAEIAAGLVFIPFKPHLHVWLPL